MKLAGFGPVVQAADLRGGDVEIFPHMRDLLKHQMLVEPAWAAKATGIGVRAGRPSPARVEISVW